MEHHEDEGRLGIDNHVKQDEEESVARQEEIKKSIEAKMALRQSNLNPARPGWCIYLVQMSVYLFKWTKVSARKREPV